MHSLLKQVNQQEHLDQQGYVLIDFINQNAVARMKTFYEQGLATPDGSGFQVGLDAEDKALVTESTKFITASLEAVAANLFEETKIFTASYVVKHPGKHAIVPPHQDWTFTDESQFASYTVWIPLVDTTVENGALCVIPGSHRFFDHPRSSPSPQSKSAIADHMFTLFPYAKPVPMKAGQALIFNNRTIHASPPNVSTEPRIAVGIGIMHKEAPIWHYYQSPEQPDTLHRYAVDEDFFIHYDNKTLSDRYDAGRLLTERTEIGTQPRIIPELSGVELESMVRSIDGNEWQQEVIDAVASLHELYKKPETKMEATEPTNNANIKAPEETTASQPTEAWVDDRTFFQKYTIPNIIAEIKWRLSGKA